MNKFIGLLIALIGFSVTSLVAQSPTPAASPDASPSVAKPKHKKKAPATAATPAASPAPTVSPTPAKRSWFKSNKPTPAPAVSPAPTAPVKKTVAPSAPSTSTPAPGAAPGMVWVNTDSHVYHKEGSRWYGKTKKGKYMTEKDAIKEGDHAAQDETKKKP